MSKKNIKISVIIPIYNAERYLETSLGQVVNQTLRDIEIICIDDGSTDCSLSILKEFARRDKRITVISQENKNAGAARNRGLEIACGKYLSFLDADDMFDLNMLEKAYNVAEEKQVEIVAYRSDRFNEKTNQYESARWTIREEYLPKKEIFSHKDMSNFFYCFAAGWAWDKLFRRDFIEKTGLKFQEQRWINDKLFVECALAYAKKIYVLDEVLMWKRAYNIGSLTSVYVQKGKSECLFNALLEIRKQLMSWGIFEELESDYYNFCLHHILWNLDQFLDDSAFDTVYTSTKTRDLPILGLAQAERGVFTIGSDYIWLEKIQKYAPSEYRWERSLSKERDHYNGAYLFPFELVPQGTKIVLYAAGKVGKTFFRQIKYTRWMESIFWVDKVSDEKKGIMPIPDDFGRLDYDYIVIAIESRDVAQEIKSELLRRGASEKRIVWRKPTICT